MICYIKGKVLYIMERGVVVESCGIGYEVNIPYRDTKVQLGDIIELWIHTYIKENEIVLYGFFRKEERDFFRLIISKVPGIGPKLALSILSIFSPEELIKVITNEEVESLSKVTGVGRKTAERLILELKTKIDDYIRECFQTKEDSTKESIITQVESALINLGFKKSQAAEALNKMLSTYNGEYEFEKLLKASLSLLYNKMK